MAVLKDRRECPMNTLSYGLLALLARNNSSGYDLMLKIQPFWQAKHSQIYPLLSRMEEQHLLSAEWIQQTDKPDKKIYAITPLGEQRLKEWMQLPAGEPVSRDELVLKAFCLWTTDRENAISLFGTRSIYYQERIHYFEQAIHKMPEEVRQFGTRDFGLYILRQKGLATAKANLEWTTWVIDMLKNSTTESSSQPQHQ